jgi:hypothetical protein
MHSNRVGDQSVGVVMAALIEAGYTVLLPFGEFRYDLVTEKDGVFRRVQVKTGRLQNGVVVFNGYSTNGSTAMRAFYDESQIDDYGVYCPALRRSYLVPAKEVASYEGRLRVDPTRNNQQRGIRLAAPYELNRT